MGVGWAAFDTAGKLQQENLLTNTYVAALRKLAPNMGAYINEVCVLLRSFPISRVMAKACNTQETSS